MGDMSVSYYIIKPAEIARAVSVFIFVWHSVCEVASRFSLFLTKPAIWIKANTNELFLT